MMHRHTAVLLSAVITSIVAAPALAQTSLKVAQADSSQALDMQLKMEEAVLAPQRAMFRRYFQQAYRRYPSIPSGTLEAMAFVQSRWSNLQPRQAQDANHDCCCLTSSTLRRAASLACWASAAVLA